MPRLDHIELPVRDYEAARDWYRDMLGFEVEMEFPEGRTVGMRDEADLTVFLHQGAPPAAAPGLSFTVQVDDVDRRAAELAARGVAFVHPPQKVYWSYGAELTDPDGYRIRLWDETSMKEKG
jgi:catechol 2,3-dioxygenase-like lactoylglutathione lyase family enzyme